MAQLILKRASASRPSGEWNADDYNVHAAGIVVGRVMKVQAERSPSAIMKMKIAPKPKTHA